MLLSFFFFSLSFFSLFLDEVDVGEIDALLDSVEREVATAELPRARSEFRNV